MLWSLENIALQSLQILYMFVLCAEIVTIVTTLVTELWYLHKYTMHILNWRFSLSTVYNETLYIQKSVSENARNAILGVE